MAPGALLRHSVRYDRRGVLQRVYDAAELVLAFIMLALTIHFSGGVNSLPYGTPVLELVEEVGMPWCAVWHSPTAEAPLLTDCAYSNSNYSVPQVVLLRPAVLEGREKALPRFLGTPPL